MFCTIKKFALLPFIEKKMLIESLFVSLYVKILLLLFSFNFIEKKIIKKKTEKIKNLNSKETILLIKKSIQRISHLIFWKNLCLEQSLTALIMLRKRKIPYTLYFGIRKNNSKLQAHVWISSESIYVIEKGNEEFTILKEYSG